MKHGLALVGYGGMAGWHHQNIKEKIPQIEVIGAYDIRPEALDKARENGLTAYDSLDALLADERIDIVTVATPNDFHKPLVIRCLEAGKNVVCEKPVALNAGELQEMMAVAKRTGKLFSIHQNRRWDRDYRIVRAVLDSGDIGKPYYIESRVEGSRGAMHGWRGYKRHGGGMLLDWGVHMIDQALDMIPEQVVEVSASLQGITSDEIDDNCKISLRFASGLYYQIDLVTNCFINLPRWRVHGTDGTMAVEDWSCKGRIVKLNESGEMTWDEDIVYTEAGPTRTMAPRPVYTTQQLELPQVETDWADFYQNIAGVLDGTAELIVRPEQALRVMRVIDAAFKAQEDGQAVRCAL